MIDGLTLDQLRTFVAVVEEGSFSATGRRLGRAQSVVSQSIANLEARIGLALFDRTGRYPVLTAGGRELLSDARDALAAVDRFKARSKAMAGGLEPMLAVVANVMLPTEALTAAVAAFRGVFPDTALHLSVEGLGAVVEPVLERRCSFAIRGPISVDHAALVHEPLFRVGYVMVAAAGHPLAGHPRPIPASALVGEVQIVLTDRSRITEGRDINVFSARTWRVSDIGAKLAFLRAGFGWGGMPEHLVADDIASGALVPLSLQDVESPAAVPMTAIYRGDTPPGPAGRWLLDWLKRWGGRHGAGSGDACGSPPDHSSPS